MVKMPDSRPALSDLPVLGDLEQSESRAGEDERLLKEDQKVPRGALG